MVHLSYLQLVAPFLLAIFLLRVFVRRLCAHSLSHLPGPPAGSWLVGNLPELFRSPNAAGAEFAWTKNYGTAARIKGAFGTDIFLTSDPKAMQYILNTTGYNFPKPQQSVVTSRLLVGRGIISAQGAQHARHRKIMNPAFSHGALRAFLPLFRHTTLRTVAKWNEIIGQSGHGATVLDIPAWLARTTLDAMGEAAFDYKFGAIDEADNELYKVYNNLATDTSFNRSNLTIAFEALWGYIPIEIVPVVQKLPTRQLKRLKNYMKVAQRVATSIIDTQTQSHNAGREGGKDVMSILVRANLSEDPKTKLTEDELLGQLTTLMFAGHETTASTVTWALYELSRHPEFQSQVRAEIQSTRASAAQRGEGELSVSDMDSMKYLLALIKETLRFHPIVPLLRRVAGRDDVIPLSMAHMTKTGQVMNDIPVNKGQLVFLSVAAYNRLESVWGEGADVWRPERFIEGVESHHKTGLGVFANVASFGSGLRGCIGWRFALIEMQAILIELLENFDFSPAPGNAEIIRASGGLMVPMIKGSPGRTELPLTVTRIM